MKNKYRFRRILSGMMAAVTILSAVISPLTVYASEEPKAVEPPAYECVKDLLDEEEVVKATDLELEVGQDFDVSTRPVCSRYSVILHLLSVLDSADRHRCFCHTAMPYPRPDWQADASAHFYTRPRSIRDEVERYGM